MMVEGSKGKTKKSDSKDLKTSSSKEVRDSPTGRLYLDIAIFFVLIIVISSAIVIASMIPKDTTSYYTNYTETDEYVEESMDNILASTIPAVSYQSQTNTELQYFDYSFQELILLDMAIRSEGDDDINLTSLETGIESELKDVLDKSLGVHSDYIFIVNEGSSQDNNRSIVISYQSDIILPSQGDKPNFEKHLIPLYSRDGDRNDLEIIIRLYIN